MKTLAALLSILLPLQSFGADEMKHVPAWTMVNGKACYEFDQAKKLVVIDSQLETLLQTNRQWMQITADLQESSRQLNIALTAEKNASALLKTNGDQLVVQLMTATGRANKAEARPGSFPAWAIAGGIGLGVGIIAGIILGVYVAK